MFFQPVDPGTTGTGGGMMAQNTSSAVMQQVKDPDDRLNYFPTPPWATRALCENLQEKGHRLRHCSVWEPACGEGHMSRPLAEYFGETLSSDVHDYGFGGVQDFLIRDVNDDFVGPDWVITNPPFRLAAQFVARGLDVANIGVAMLVRIAFLEGVNRYRSLYANNPPAFVLQYCERVPMFKGELRAKGSTATAYCWIVWIKGSEDPQFGWIAPCRKRLERAGDYSRKPVERLPELPLYKGAI